MVRLMIFKKKNYTGDTRGRTPHFFFDLTAADAGDSSNSLRLSFPSLFWSLSLMHSLISRMPTFFLASLSSPLVMKPSLLRSMACSKLHTHEKRSTFAQRSACYRHRSYTTNANLRTLKASGEWMSVWRKSLILIFPSLSAGRGWRMALTWKRNSLLFLYRARSSHLIELYTSLFSMSIPFWSFSTLK